MIGDIPFTPETDPELEVCPHTLLPEKGGEKMNINNLTISQVPQIIIRNTVNPDKGCFANMLIDATEKFSLVSLIGKNGNSLSAGNTPSILNEADVTEGDEAGKKIDYGNLCGLPSIFLLIPSLLTNDVMTQNTGDAAAFESQFTYGGGHTIELPQDEIPFIKQGSAAAEKTVFENVTAEKPMSEYVTAEKPIFKNIVAEKTMIENLTAEKTMQKSIPTEKIIQKSIPTEKTISENKTTEKNLRNIIQYDTPEAALRHMPTAENKIISVTDESTEIKAKILSQVRDKIIITAEKDLSGDMKTINMQLQPQNLGKVDIKLIFEENKLTVEIKAFNEETQKILSSSIGELKEMLSKTSDVKVIVKTYADDTRHYQNEHGNEQYFYQGQEQNQGHERQRNNYYHKHTKNTKDDIFSELINSNSIELKEGILGN